jgi:predicted amidophosphoribosyltransferase
MSFKDKPLKKIVADKRVTIDVLHNEIIDEFKSNKEKYILNKQLLETLLKQETKDNEQIKYLKNQIKEYEDINLEKETNYYLDTSLLLNTYYNKKNNDNNDNNVTHNFFGNNIVSMMNDNSNKQVTKTQPKKIKNENTIIDTYMTKIDDSKLLNYRIDNYENCPNCNETFTFKNLECQMVCEKCGYTENVIINTEKISYKDPPRESSFFAYKRINHFNEWIAQFQAKETTDISDNIYNEILFELNKHKNLNIKEIKYKQIREILKKLKYNKYYEHIPHIINVLSGKKAPLLSRNQEEQLRMMFKEIQMPFMKFCPEERKNFLSYSYVLHKFCELIELDELLEHFPYLKSREKLQQQDLIWEKICKELSWQYIPSV